MIENEKIEFKKTTNEINEAMISIASILNKNHEGVLYFGLKNDGSPFKLTITESTMRDISRKIYESIKPQIYPTIEMCKINDIDVIKVSFKGDDVPYSAFGRYYMRTFDEDRELTPSELKKLMILKEYEENWENKTSNDTIVDVDEKTLKNFYLTGVESNRLPSIPYDKEALLNMLGVLNENYLTNAGRMLFSNKKPIILKTIVFATSERTTILDLNKINGNIFELIDESMKFIVKNIRWRVENQGLNLERKEIPEIPIDAIREAIINSFAHARYDGNVEHEIDIYSNRISIINPGSFANEFTPIDFYKRNLKSYLRNEIIANVLYKRKDVETAGYGLKKIYTLCDEAKVRLNYINNENDFTLEFSRLDRNLYQDIDVNISLEKKLNKEETEILNAIRNDNYISRVELIAMFNYSTRKIDRIISSLKFKGLLERVGSNKTGHWRTK